MVAKKHPEDFKHYITRWGIINGRLAFANSILSDVIEMLSCRENAKEIIEEIREAKELIVDVIRLNNNFSNNLVHILKGLFDKSEEVM